jgi:hypothetical protein
MDTEVNEFTVTPLYFSMPVGPLSGTAKLTTATPVAKRPRPPRRKCTGGR